MDPAGVVPRFVPLAPLDNRRAFRRAVIDSASSRSSLTGGGSVALLEETAARHLGGDPKVLALSSGTAALHTALLALGIGPGDEVILPAYDWGAAAAAVRAAGATAIPADIHPGTYTLDPASAETRVGRRTAAVVATHLFGQAADLESLRRMADRHRLALIEDAAQAMGTTYRGRHVGTVGDVACFSLGVGKTIDVGEGGLLVTGSADLYRAAVRVSQHPSRQLRDGVDTPDHLALNLRIHPFAAAAARALVPAIADHVERRRRAAELLDSVLAAFPQIHPPHRSRDGRHSFHRYSPTVAERHRRETSLESITRSGLPASAEPLRVPIHRRIGGRPTTEECPVADRQCRQGLLVALPDPDDPASRAWAEYVSEASRPYQHRI